MSVGRVLQLNISAGGIPKTPIESAEVGPLGIRGDGHRYRMHGGRNKALLILASEVVDAMQAEGWPVFYGALGENITTRDVDHATWCKGQHWRIGEVLVELTTAREPCKTLARYGVGIQQRISLRPGEGGFYARVIEPGLIVKDAIINQAE